MAFCIAVSPLAPPRSSVVLSGPTGAIAKHVLGLGSRAEEGWNLEGEQLAGLLLPGQAGTVYWTTGEGPRCRVLRICGRSLRDATEILVHLQPLNEEGVPRGAQTAEALCLRGGYATPQASWAWAPPKMSIGAVRLG